MPCAVSRHVISCSELEGMADVRMAANFSLYSAEAEDFLVCKGLGGGRLTMTFCFARVMAIDDCIVNRMRC